MVCLGLKPGVAGWKTQTNLLSFGGTRLTNIDNTRQTAAQPLYAEILRQIEAFAMKIGQPNPICCHFTIQRFIHCKY